ncbi:hypothetical protein QR680_008009 [Steinernema hermaphroditum]|uniref:Uncharacterized protein n=1 Tax=Steinernema hermaphroditum TaxID=289476 RepID=A0AA39M7B3_9BILA|nr:hypothetical protein QR680_001200 [Steinernema hermaphroditum]KAK0423169.1 hypothetical protein QR680_008009 [Steinernema hermaphroditum]
MRATVYSESERRVQNAKEKLSLYLAQLEEGEDPDLDILVRYCRHQAFNCAKKSVSILARNDENDMFQTDADFNIELV